MFSDHKLYLLQNIDKLKVCFRNKYNFDNYNTISQYYHLIDYSIIHNMIITQIIYAYSEHKSYPLVENILKLK